MSLCKCPICGAEKRNLTKHVKMAHDMAKDDFLNMYPNTKMVSEETSELNSKSTIENWKDEEYRKSCSSYTKEKGNKGGASQKGTKRSDEAKANYKAASLTEKGRTTRSQTMRKVVNKLWKDENYRARQSEKGQRQAVEYMQDENRGHKRYKYNGISYRSTWEVKLAEVLCKLGVNFEYEKGRFYYSSKDGARHFYVPDFYLTDYNFYVEVKPKEFITEVTDLKMEAVRNDGFDIYYLSTNNSNEIKTFITNLCQTKTP